MQVAKIWHATLRNDILPCPERQLHSLFLHQTLDVLDTNGEPIEWRPAIITFIEKTKVRIHWLFWNSKWDRWIDIHEDRFAPLGSHTKMLSTKSHGRKISRVEPICGISNFTPFKRKGHFLRGEILKSTIEKGEKILLVKFEKEFHGQNNLKKRLSFVSGLPGNTHEPKRLAVKKKFLCKVKESNGRFLSCKWSAELFRSTSIIGGKLSVETFISRDLALVSRKFSH